MQPPKNDDEKKIGRSLAGPNVLTEEDIFCQLE
jgi:hypothetical protein